MTQAPARPSAAKPLIESHLNYLSSALSTMDKQGLATFDVRRGAQQEYNDDLQVLMGRTIWKTGGCASWYLDKHGNNTTLWPGFTFAFRRLTCRFDVTAYETTKRADVPLHLVPASA